MLNASWIRCMTSSYSKASIFVCPHLKAKIHHFGGRYQKPAFLVRENAVYARNESVRLKQKNNKKSPFSKISGAYMYHVVLQVLR